MKSEITKKYSKLNIIFTILSWFLCFGTAAFLIVYAVITGNQGGEEASVKFTEIVGPAVYGYLLSLLPMIVLAIIAKDKVKPVVWMIDVVMGNFLLGAVAMYTIFGLWLADNYIVSPLKLRFRQQRLINTEIDKRS